MTEKDELVEAVKEWTKKTRARTTVNKKAEQASKDVAEAKAEVDRIMAERKVRVIGVGPDNVSRTQKTHYYVKEANRADFEAWALNDDEELLEAHRRINNDAFKRRMEQIAEDGEALPPGVSSYTEYGLSKRKA